MRVDTGMSLEYFCTYRGRLKAPLDLGIGRSGNACSSR